MKGILFLYAFVLFFLITPKVLFHYPQKSSVYVVAALHAFVFSILFTLLQWCINCRSFIEGNENNDKGKKDDSNPLCSLPKTSDEYRRMLKYIPSKFDFHVMKGYLAKDPILQKLLLNTPEFKKIEENQALSNEEKIAQTIKLINNKLDERDSTCVQSK